MISSGSARVTLVFLYILPFLFFFFFNDTATSEIYTLSLHDALPISAAQYCKYFITSVDKGIQTAVKNAVTTAQGGTFKGGNYIGTLANGGVGLAPFHDFASKVPASVQAELATIKTDIENGTIKPATKSPA